MPNDSLIMLIKKAAMDAVRASKPCDTQTGRVISLSPLQVNVGQKLPLSAEFLEVTTTAAERMKTGSRVLLLRQSGGQKYTVVDTIR